MKTVDPVTVLKSFVALEGGCSRAAQALGVTRQFVWRMTNGQKPIPDLVLAKLGLIRVVVRI